MGWSKDKKERRMERDNEGKEKMNERGDKGEREWGKGWLREGEGERTILRREENHEDSLV